MTLRNELHGHIGYRSNPEPFCDPSEGREDAISSRIDDIWADPDLLLDAMTDAGFPFDLDIASRLLKQSERLITQRPSEDDEADACLRRMCDAIEAAVREAAEWHVDNRDPF